MWFVYVLRSVEDGTLFIGSTEDLDSALRDHASGKNKETTKLGELSCDTYIGVATKKQAKKLETYLKSKPGTKVLLEQILDAKKK